MIPVNEPLLTARELELATECLRTGWISSAGGYIQRFDALWHAYLMEAPVDPVADADPKNSPWLRLLRQR